VRGEVFRHGAINGIALFGPWHRVRPVLSHAGGGGNACP
jgi:hypothetical protein